MQPQFTLCTNPADKSQKLLTCEHLNSYLTVITRFPGQDVELDYRQPVYNAFFGPKDGSVILHFTVHPADLREEADRWSDELILAAIHFHNESAGFTDLMMMHEYPCRNLYEAENCPIKQLYKEPEFLVDQYLTDYEPLTEDGLLDWLTKEE